MKTRNLLTRQVLIITRLLAPTLLLATILFLVMAWPASQAADRAAVGSQETLTLYADADATTKSWEPDANFGNDTQLQLHYSNFDAPRAAFTLIHFDVSSIPADAVIDSATLELCLWSSAGADPVWIGLYDVYAGWNESTVTATPRRTDTPTPSPTPTAALPPGCPDRLVNGGFEAGSLAPWLAYGPIGLLGPLLGQAPAACTGQVPNQERVALIGLYTSTGGTSWSNRTGWLGADPPPCSWYGIACGCDLTTGSYIKTIDLEYNNLTGAIPLELVNFHRLSGLVLSGNNLTGSIPADLGSLDQLSALFLDSNKLTGQVPQTILDLPHLRALNLGWNDLSGNRPVPTYGGLERLYLSANHFTGNVPPFGYGQRSLVQLWLSDNDLTGSIPASLGAQADLEDLLLDGNALTGAIPSELSNLKNLHNLDLSYDHLIGPIPPELGSLSALKQLRLNNNQLSGPIPATLGGLANLRYLRLHNNRLSGGVPTELGQLGNVWDFTFDRNPDLVGPLPYGLMNDVNLMWLSYSDTQLCASGDAPFQEWLDGLVARGEAETSGLTCTGAQVSSAIPPRGGTLTSPGDRTVYTFGPGAFGGMASGVGETGISATAIVTHTPQAPAAAPPTGMLRGIGHFFDVTASVNGQPAAPIRPYTLTVTFGLNQIQTVLSETLGLYWWDGTAWRQEPGSAVNVAAHTITAHPSHLSLWAVLGVSKYREFLPLLRK